MKKVNLTTVIMVLLISFAAYKLVKRYLLKPKMQFEQAVLTNIADSGSTSVAALRGQVLIVSCYQTWCGDCARETPELNELAAKINSPNFTVLYISDEPAEKVERFRSRFAGENIRYVHTQDKMDTWGIRAFPTTFLINKKGEVIKTELGGYNWAREEKNIRALLAE